MNENIQQAVNNISSVLFQGRIEMPAGALTAQEHNQLSADFSLLVTRAKLATKLEEEQKAGKELGTLKPDFGGKKKPETEDSK